MDYSTALKLASFDPAKNFRIRKHDRGEYFAEFVGTSNTLNGKDGFPVLFNTPSDARDYIRYNWLDIRQAA